MKDHRLGIVLGAIAALLVACVAVAAYTAVAFFVWERLS
jgi:hypothetical protein